jgi:uridine phosphorylase
MTTERVPDRLDSVFDLRIHKALSLSESVSTRVRLTYSRTESSKKFNVLSEKTTEEMKNKISSWLDTHIAVDDLLCHLGTNEIDMDTLPRAAKD